MNRKSMSGFTLIEVMIVVVIISVLVGIAIPDIISWLPKYRLKNATRDLVSFMQKTKMEAVKNNSSLEIIFNSSSSPGFYYLDSDEDSSWDVGEERLFLGDYKSGIDYGSGSASKNWDDESISKVISFPSALLRFSARGMSNSWGTVFLENKNSDICFAITVLATGSINVREWTGTTWTD